MVIQQAQENIYTPFHIYPLVRVLRPLKPLCRLVPTARPLDIVPSVISKYHALKASCQWLAFAYKKVAQPPLTAALAWQEISADGHCSRGFEPPLGAVAASGWKLPGRTLNLVEYKCALRERVEESSHTFAECKVQCAILCIRQIATLVSKKRQKATKKRGRGGKGGVTTTLPPVVVGHWSRGIVLKLTQTNRKI